MEQSITPSSIFHLQFFKTSNFFEKSITLSVLSPSTQVCPYSSAAFGHHAYFRLTNFSIRKDPSPRRNQALQLVRSRDKPNPHIPNQIPKTQKSAREGIELLRSHLAAQLGFDLGSLAWNVCVLTITIPREGESCDHKKVIMNNWLLYILCKNTTFGGEQYK